MVTRLLENIHVFDEILEEDEEDKEEEEDDYEEGKKSHNLSFFVSFES